jgi:hypothetical protein
VELRWSRATSAVSRPLAADEVAVLAEQGLGRGRKQSQAGLGRRAWPPQGGCDRSAASVDGRPGVGGRGVG